jgi:hypothetical protein
MDISDTGKVYVVGRQLQGTDKYKLYIKDHATGFVTTGLADQHALRVSVNGATPWIVTHDGKVKALVGASWVEKCGTVCKALDITARDSGTWIVSGTQQPNGKGNTLMRWNAASSSFVAVSTAVTKGVAYKAGHKCTAADTSTELTGKTADECAIALSTEAKCQGGLGHFNYHAAA